MSAWCVSSERRHREGVRRTWREEEGWRGRWTVSSRGEDGEMALFLFIWRERGIAYLRQYEVYEERRNVERRSGVVISCVKRGKTKCEKGN
jgi:hypothetical protein